MRCPAPEHGLGGYLGLTETDVSQSVWMTQGGDVARFSRTNTQHSLTSAVSGIRLWSGSQM